MSDFHIPDGLEDLVAPDAEFEEIAGGFLFTEGPGWQPGTQELYFSDIPGDARWKWSEAAGLQLVERPAYLPNGTVFEPDGNMLVCEQVTSSLIRIRPDGWRQVVGFGPCAVNFDTFAIYSTTNEIQLRQKLTVAQAPAAASRKKAKPVETAAKPAPSQLSRHQYSFPGSSLGMHFREAPASPTFGINYEASLHRARPVSRRLADGRPGPRRQAQQKQIPCGASRKEARRRRSNARSP